MNFTLYQQQRRGQWSKHRIEWSGTYHSTMQIQGNRKGNILSGERKSLTLAAAEWKRHNLFRVRVKTIKALLQITLKTNSQMSLIKRFDCSVCTALIM